MAIARASAAPRSLGRTVLRRAAAKPQPQAWRQIGRRNYASGHGSEQKSSEIPWMIGSIGFTVPAAYWLFGQGPQKGAHGSEAAHEEKHVTENDKQEPDEEAHDAKAGEAAPSEGSSQEPADEKESGKEEKSEQDGGSDAGKSDSDKSKDESPDESSDKQSSGKGKDEGTEDSKSPNAPGQINYKPESGKGPGEGQKGPRRPAERKGEKDSASDKSGATNPYLEQNAHEKSKKGEGLVDTMKIHGTVDSRRPQRGTGNEDENKR